MAGAGDKGLPNGRPVDEWGIRMEKDSCNPAGSSVTRGGAVNGPAAVYAIRKWDEWLRKYAPPRGSELRFLSVASGPVPGKRRAADILVHGVYFLDGRPEERRQQYRR